MSRIPLSPPLTPAQRESFIVAIDRWQQKYGKDDATAAWFLDVSQLRFLQWMNGTLIPTREEVERVLNIVGNGG